MTVGKLISYGAEFLRKHKISDAFLNAELLIAHMLKVDRKELYVRIDEELDTEQIEGYNNLLQKRGNFEPLQYIVGYAEFYGRRFIVTKDVLIPRPETELIIDEIKKHYNNSKSFSLLDIGTGSGNIAITVQKEIPTAKVFATDVSYAAINIAKLNSRMHELKDYFYLVCSDLFSAIKPDSEFDVIVANPPYIPTERIKSLQPEIKLYEPEEAINGGLDGMVKIKEIILRAWHFIKKGGKLIIEIDATQGESVLSLLEETGRYRDPQLKKDLAGLNRLLIATRK